MDRAAATHPHIGQPISHRVTHRTFLRLWRVPTCLCGIVALALAIAATQVAAVPDTVEQRAKACTGCHGPQGKSRPDGYVPRLAGKPAGYLHEQLVAFREGRRTHATMARLLEHLDDAMLRELAAWFAAQEVAYPPPAGVTPPGDAGRRAAQVVQRGDARHDVPACVACHGEALTGIAPGVPGLVGLPRDYLVAQLGAWREGARRSREPDCMAAIARRLPAADTALVAQWLAAQPVPVPSTPSTVIPSTWPLECGVLSPSPRVTGMVTPASATAADAVQRGAYLARVGNCAGCHTAPGGRPYAGGRGIPTPFGTVYASNITPDVATGIGTWTSDDFARALHEGRSRDGRYLAPAFPYTSYARVSREDSDAIFAYLRSVAPVAQPSRPHELRFPFGTQAALAAWQWLFFTPARRPAPASKPSPGSSSGSSSQASAMAPVPASAAAPASQVARSERVARGEYLVRGLGHCDACHAPRNGWGAPDGTLTGGVIPAQGWHAPKLHPVEGGGAAAADLVALLRGGRNAHGSASGPMAGVVQQSTQYWTDADLAAAAAYLATLSPQPLPRVRGAPASPEVLARGERLYDDRCADCHGRDGRGEPGAYPPLAGNPTVLEVDARNLVQVLHWGAFGPVTATVPRPYGMPPQDLDDVDTAAVLSFVRQAWGNRAGAVTPVEVLAARELLR